MTGLRECGQRFPCRIEVRFPMDLQLPVEKTESLMRKTEFLPKKRTTC